MDYKNNEDYQGLLKLRLHMSILLALDEERRNKIADLEEKIEKNKKIMDLCYDKSPTYSYEDTPETIEALKKFQALHAEVDKLSAKKRDLISYNTNTIIYKKFNKELTALSNLNFYLPIIVFIACAILLPIYAKQIYQIFPFVVEKKWLYYVGTVFALTFIIWIITKCAYKSYFDKNHPANVIERLDKEIREKQQLESEAYKLSTKKKTIYNNTAGKVLPSEKERYNKCKKNINNCNNKILKINGDMYNVVSEFRKMKYVILEQDYKYIDYLLFLFESGRCDNIQIALQQLDMERRNVELLNKLDQFSGSINYNLGKITEALKTQTIVLSESFEKAIGSAAKLIVGKINETNKKLDNIDSSIKDVEKAANDISATVEKVGK